ncbi:MAG: 5-(carboxyamino)imidazole ribonucleotide synthase [Alicyclobacillaceae bacterium]|nr:5-(carboxyamino)imidazole ribonucleotide synthase [Alicyclobacillaceae bacterium]
MARDVHRNGWDSGRQPAPAGRVVLPGSLVGILGGGQLGRMMALEGRRMGYRFAVLDPTEDSPCGQVADIQVVAPYTDVDAARRLAEMADVITYEFENVDAGVASVLERTAYVPQGSRLLATTQHRLREKRALVAAGAPVAPFAPVGSLNDLRDALAVTGLPAVLKTCTGGYDGKGQWKITTPDDLEAVWAEASRAVGLPAAGAAAGAGAEAMDAPLMVEGFVPFVHELSAIVARSPRGQVRTFPVAENIHRDHILHLSVVPARIPQDIQRQAQAFAERIAVSLGGVGLLAVEMFLTADGRLFVNELAPRPHNSGHYTYDACATSQFEQHLRAVCNLPLGSVRLLTPVVMVNILGEHVAPVLRVLPQLPDNVKVHLYGKHEAKSKRKMGHLNVLADSVEEALDTIRALDIWLL